MHILNEYNGQILIELYLTVWQSNILIIIHFKGFIKIMKLIITLIQTNNNFVSILSGHYLYI